MRSLLLFLPVVALAGLAWWLVGSGPELGTAEPGPAQSVSSRAEPSRLRSSAELAVGDAPVPVPAEVELVESGQVVEVRWDLVR